MSPRFWQFIAIILPLAAGAALLDYAPGPGWGKGLLLLALGVTLMLLVTGLGTGGDAGQGDGATTDPDDPAYLKGDLGRELLELLPMPIFLIEQGGRIGYANVAARELFPRLPQARHFANLLRAPAFIAAVTRASETDTVQEADFPFLRGGELSLRAHVCPTRGPHIAENPPLLVLIEDRTHDRKVEMLRSDFIANASHELRTPIASILGSIETLEGPARDDPEGQARFLALMARQALRMKRLVEDLLSLSQIELGERMAPRETCDLADAAREAAASLAPLTRKQDARVEVALPDRPLEVRGDRDQLIQVFVNLIENALKYGGTGTAITLSATGPDSRWPKMLGVTVADDGPGIPREHVPRLTERFYRVSAKASRDKGGTGLGLAIVKHVLNRHRGELQIESTPGAGSRFTVWLPESPEAAEQSESDLPGRHISDVSEKIDAISNS